MLPEWLVKYEEEEGAEEGTPDVDTISEETVQKTDVKVLPRRTLINLHNECKFHSGFVYKLEIK